MSDQNFNQSMKHFCGGSNATGLFMEANYHGNNYTTPINSANKPELIQGMSLENILLAKNYLQSSKPNGMVDNDVHHQYVDFIIRTALFHRELDMSTGVGSGIEEIKNSLKEGIELQLNSTIETLSGIGNSRTALRNLLDSVAWIGVNGDQINDISLSSIGLNENSTFYEYLVAVIVMLSLSNTFRQTNSYPSDVNALKRVNVTSPFFLSDVGSFTTVVTKPKSFNRIFESLAGKCENSNLPNENKGVLGDLCALSLISKNESNSANQKIANILTKNKKGQNELNQILNKIHESLSNELAVFAVSIHRELGGLAGMHATFNVNKNQNTVRQMKNQIIENKLIRQGLEERLTSVILENVRREINMNTASNYTRVNENSHATKMFENVYLNWGNLDREAREFYRVHARIFRKVGNVIGSVNEYNGWEDIKDKVDDATFLKSLNKNEIRINLMKERQGSLDVLFGKTLPFLPVAGSNAIRNIWYTPANSTVPQSIPAINVSTSFLQDLYACVYSGNCNNVNGIPMALPTKFSQVENKTGDFAIDDILVIKNFISARKNSSVSQPSTSFDALFVEDMTSQIVWRLDESNNLYRIENGRKIPYSPDEITIENCVGSRLAGDRQQCSKMVRECLLSGDKNALNDCIGSLRAANMFDVAQSECQHVDPAIAVQILRTFGIGKITVKDSVLGEINVPQPFDHYKTHTLAGLKPALRDAILNDNKLCDYLKGVIAFITTNPAILNKHISQDAKTSLVNQQVNDPYLDALKKTLYVNPYQTQQEQKIFAAQSLLKSVQYPQIAVSSPSQLTNPFNNVTYGQNALNLPASRLLSGGSPYEDSIIRKIKRNGSTAQLISTLMENLFTEMKNSGIPVNDVDRARINDGINKLAHGEKTLAKYYNMLRALTDLALFFKSSGCDKTQEELKELSLDTIKSREDTISYLYQNIGEVQNCINNGIADQNLKCKELINSYSILVNNNTNGTLKLSSL